MMNVTHVMRHYEDVLNHIDIESNEKPNETKKQQLERARNTFELYENPISMEFDEPFVYRIIIKKNEKLEFYETPVAKGKLLTAIHTLDDTITRVSRDQNSHYWPLMIRVWQIIKSYPHHSKNVYEIHKNKN